MAVVSCALVGAEVHANESEDDALVPASIDDKLLGARVAVTGPKAAGAAPGREVVVVPPARAGGRCP